MFKRVCLLFAAVVIVAPPEAVAQVTYGSISGSVRDGSGAVIPGATITAVNTGTDISRATVTDEDGRYQIPQLSLGLYRVSAELSGFRVAVRTGIRLTVGREALVDLTLSLGDVRETVEVRGEAPLVDARSATLSGLVEETQVQELPLNGRDVMQLVLNQQGVVFYRSSRPSASTGIGTRMSVGGARDNQNNFLMDGTDINDVANSTPGGATGASLGVETIREFQILTNAYSAEFGRNAGAVMNVVTRSGTNSLDGTVYHFLRNDVFDARNFFAAPGADQPPYKRNQFGGMVAGPIRKGSTFFLFNYEGLRERLGLSFVSRVPTADARTGVLPSRTVQVAPSVPPYLELYPLPNGRLFGDGSGEYFSSNTRATDQDLFVARIDHTFSANDSVFVRYTVDDSKREQPDGFGLFSSDFAVRNQYLTFEHQHIFSPRLLNTFRFGYNNSFNDDFNSEIRPVDPALSFVPGEIFGSLTVTGLSSVGTNTLGPRTWDYTAFDFQNHLTFTSGRHALKGGVNIKRFVDDHEVNRQKRGQYAFLGLQQFLEGRANTIEVMLPGSDAVRRMRQSLYGFYVQHDFQVHPRLTLNQGLRYEFITVPTEVDGKLVNLRHVMDPATTVGPYFRNPSLKNFGPRFGVAWDPFGDGKTAVRGGAGIFYDQVLSPYIAAGVTAQQPPFYQLANARNPPFPNFIQIVSDADVPPLVRVLAIDYNIKTPTRYQYNVSLQRELLRGIVFNAGYVGSQSRNQIALVNEHNTAIGEILPDGGKFFAPNLPRRNPNFENINFRKGGFKGSYHSMQAGLNKRFTDGILFQVSYTYGNNRTDGDTTIATSTDPNGDEIVDPDNPTMGRSQFDIAHNLVLNAVFELPFGAGRKWGDASGPLVRAIFGDWDISGLATFSSGYPFSPVLGFDRARQHVRSGGGGQRPDLAPGCSENPVLGGSDRYFDAECFLLPDAGFYGNLGRNTIEGPGLISVDAALVKNIPLGGDRRLQFRAEFFNLLNRANFELPSRTVFRAGGVRDPAAGRITSTATSARQMQFGLKVRF